MGFSPNLPYFLSIPSYIDTYYVVPSGLNEFTMSCWFICEGSAAADAQYILCNWGSSNFCFLLEFLYGSKYFRAKFYNSNSTEYNLQEASGISPVSNWYHLVGTYKRNDYARFYKNGVETVAAVGTADYELNGDLAYNVHVGRHHSGSLGWPNARINDVRFYPKTLTAAQIRDIYNNTEKHHS